MSYTNNQLLGEVNRNTEDKIKNLDTRKKKLFNYNEKVCRVINYTEQRVKLCSDDEVMSMHRDIISIIQAQITESDEQKTDMTSPEKADLIVKVDCAEALQQFCDENTWITEDTMPVDMLEVKKLPKTIEVGEELKFTIQNNNSKNIISVKNLKCQFQCMDTAAVYSAKIDTISADRYEIAYIPPVHGQFVISISAYDNPVPSSPFSVVAYLSPIKLSISTKNWKILTKD